MPARYEQWCARHEETEKHFSHKDKAGQRALDRYIALGGTEAEVGEILGVGPDSKAITDSWKTSYSHRNVLKKARWTHFGEGKYSFGGNIIYVVLFIQKYTKELQWRWLSEGKLWFLKGRWAESYTCIV